MIALIYAQGLTFILFSLLCSHKLTKEEREAINVQFPEKIRLLKVPGKNDCLNAMKKEKCLAKHDWKKIKYSVYNIIITRKRKPFA